MSQTQFVSKFCSKKLFQKRDVIKNSTLSNLMLVAEIPCQAKIFFTLEF